MQAGQETGGVVDILVWVEHVAHAAEVFGVVVVVDLHAAKIDQFLAFPLGNRKRGKGFAPALGEDCLSFYIQCVRLKAAFFPCFGKADRVEDTRRNAVAVGSPQDFGFTSVCRRTGTWRESAR